MKANLFFIIACSFTAGACTSKGFMVAAAVNALAATINAFDLVRKDQLKGTTNAK